MTSEQHKTTLQWQKQTVDMRYSFPPRNWLHSLKSAGLLDTVWYTKEFL